MYIDTPHLALNPIKCMVIGRANSETDHLNSFQCRITVIAP